MNEWDIGFRYRAQETGNVEVTFRGRVVTMLRNKAASDFLAKIALADEAEAQQIMARVTGNFKRGNERSAKKHPRNL